MDIENKPLVLSLSKHERRSNAPFDKLRVNGEKYVFSIMDSLVSVTYVPVRSGFGFSTFE